MSKSATNWSEQEDGYTQEIYSQQQSQVWFPEEIPLLNDSLPWADLSPEQRLCYIRASAGLNAMDTLQGEVGMPILATMIEGHQRKATLRFQGIMEDVHARSYSLMNKTFLSTGEEREVFEWIERQPQLQHKIAVLKDVYENGTLLQKMATSCMLETALFYSGFFYPLYLAGQGVMVNAGEIFNLIIRDEAVHGVYVGLLAQEELAKLNPDQRLEFDDWFQIITHELYRNECVYTEAVYGDLGLTSEVKKFVRYNFNNMCDNLGIERLFIEEEINPIVANGIKTKTTTHDFFSSKGNGYIKIDQAPLSTLAIEELWNVQRVVN